MEARPLPDLVNGRQEYEVEAILAHRRYKGKHQYFVKGKDYDSRENTWEPEQNLTNMEELLNDYKNEENSETEQPKDIFSYRSNRPP